MKVINTSIPDVKVIEPSVFGDERGFFLESWRDSWSVDLSLTGKFVQDNHSKSRLGTLRGLHYQVIKPQGKLVRVTQGKVFDVAVDMREYSPHYGKWVGIELSSENMKMLWVPPGFAHGFFVLSEFAEFQYKCTEYYAPEHERCLLWNDPYVAVKWPISTGNVPLLSEKDSRGSSFAEADCFKGLLE